MDYDFEVMMSEVTESSILTLEIGVGLNGKPVYRVSMFNGIKWTGARYHSFGAARATYQLLRRVI